MSGVFVLPSGDDRNTHATTSIPPIDKRHPTHHAVGRPLKCAQQMDRRKASTDEGEPAATREGRAKSHTGDDLLR